MIHKFSMYGTNIVIDVNSGAIHIVDDETFRLLDGIHSPEDLFLLGDSEIAAELKVLVENNELFSEDVYESYVNVKDEQIVKALCLHVAHDCNLKCAYCFAGEGEYHGERGFMSADVGKKAIDFLIDNSGTRRFLEVDFFGGEPTLNFDVVKEIVTYARARESESEKRFRFTLTTNGILLGDEINSFLNEHMENVVLSIDGRREVNEKMRGGYDTIVPAFNKLVKSRGGKNYYVRGTYTHENLDFCEDVLHLADLGFEQISVEPVVADEEKSYALSESDLPILLDQYEKLVSDMLRYKEEGRGFNFFHFNIDLNGGPCVLKRVSGCGAGGEYLAVTPHGDIYPCHQLVGIQEFLLGNINEGAFLKVFQENSIYHKPKCRECWAKFYCSGGCASTSYLISGDINKPYKLACELMKKRTECAIYLASQE